MGRTSKGTLVYRSGNWCAYYGEGIAGYVRSCLDYAVVAKDLGDFHKLHTDRGFMKWVRSWSPTSRESEIFFYPLEFFKCT